MFDRLLVPLDGSDLAELALPYAAEIAVGIESEVTLLHVSESTNPKEHRARQFYLQKIAESTIQQARHGATEATPKAMRTRPITLAGNAAREILDYVDREDIDLIVMGTHGRSGAKRWLMGSVANKVVRASRKPVVIVRSAAVPADVSERGKLRKVLVPLDGSEESESVIPYVEDIGLRLKAEIALFQSVEQGYHVLDPEVNLQAPFSPGEMEPLLAKAEGDLDRAAKVLGDKGIATSTEVRIGEAAEEILAFAEEIGADLVAMSTHGRSGFGRWAFGSVAEKVLQASASPIMLVSTAPAERE